MFSPDSRRPARTPALAGGLAALLCLGAAAARADVYRVSLDTSGLSNADSYGIDLQLNQGDPLDPASTVTVSGFSFAGGGALDTNPADLFLSGSGIGGSLDGPGGVTLTTAPAPHTDDFTQDFSQVFAAGSAVSFTVDATGLSAQAAGAAAPDQFVFDLYDNSAAPPLGAPVPTTDALGNGSPAGFELLTLTGGGGSLPQTYQYTGGDGLPRSLSVTRLSAVPEPSPWALLGAGGLLLGGPLRRARRRPHAG